VGDAGQVILVNCDNIRVENLNLSQATIGLQLLETNNTIISGNNITYNSESGIWLASSSSYNSVSGNNITGNWNGVSLIGASYNSISGDNIAGNGFGIWLLSSSYNSVSGNNIAASGHCGIDLQSSSSNSIIGNNITAGFDYGSILLWYSSSDNKFYHNNIINNSRQVYIEDLANVWDDGYPSGGNYWSDYVGVDIKKGPTQDQHGSDNIGDTPYAINTDNVDHYPLMNPYGSPPPPTYSLTITTTAGGTTNPPPGTYTYSQGQTVPVQATPNIGYVFAHWELDSTNVSLTNPISVLMDENHALHVVFVGMNYTLQITTTVGGMTTPAPGLHTYMNGTEVAITAIPSNNYMFDHWELDGASIGSNNPVTITMDANHTLHAVFRAHIFEELYMKGPYYTQYGVQYWIVRFGNGRGMRLVSNYY
jgi:parallel beta-helix repeat protein